MSLRITASAIITALASVQSSGAQIAVSTTSTISTSGPTSSNTPNTTVLRDAAGGFAAGTLTLAGKIDQTSVDGFVARGTYTYGTIPASGSGVRMMWYPRKAAFRAGATSSQWDDANIGPWSLATGFQTLASGDAATAMGSMTAASGQMSTALGSYASTNGKKGSFVYGDASGTGVVTNTADNQFVVRAVGGTIFYSSFSLTSGVLLAAGSGSWASVSDVKKKENFRDVDGDSVLAKIARLSIREWNYKAQPASIRHLGPTAQDFRAAFGLGESDTTITTVDIDGVNLLAIQVLERRTTELRAALQDLQTLRSEVSALREEIAALEARRPAP